MRCWIFFVLFFPTVLLSQSDVFTFYSVNDGLAQSTVMSIYKDPNGLLWAGTGDGLSLFNGISFRNIQKRYDDPKGLSNNTVRHFLPDHAHHCIWAGTEAGLTCFNESGTKILDKMEFPESISNESVPLLANDTCVWLFISGKGIYKVNKASHRRIKLRDDYLFYFYNIIEGTDIIYYQNFKEQLVRFHLFSGKAEILPLPSGAPGFVFTDMIPEGEGYLFSSTNGLWRSDKQCNYFLHVKTSPAVVNTITDNFSCLARDSSGHYWTFIPGKGLFSSDAALTNFRPQCWQQSGENILSKLVDIKNIYCDAYNVLWFGSEGHGLIRYTGNRLFFGNSFYETPVTDSVHWFVRTFYKEQNVLWVGTYDGGLKEVDYSRKTVRSWKTPLFRGIFFITGIGDHSLLLGTETGLFIFKDGKFQSFGTGPSSPPLEFHNVLRLRDHRMIFGTSSHLMASDEKNKTVTRFGHDPGNFSGMIETAAGTIICASAYNGIYFFDQQLHQLKMIRYDSLGIPQASIITGFVPDDQEGLWAASNMGLLHFDKKFHLAEVLTSQDGLPGNMIYGIVKLPGGALFLSTGAGVSVFDPAAKTFRNYSYKDGLRSNECNTRALLFSDDQYLYVGGINGFNWKKFPFTDNAYGNPGCFMENFVINDSIGGNSSSLEELKYNENTISFNLYNSDFAFSESWQWMYRMDGPETSTVVLPPGSPFRFYSLAPGNYTIHVYAKNSGKESFSMSYAIVPPWWNTLWFRLLSVFFVLLVSVLSFYLILNYRYRKNLRKQEAMRAVEKIRTRISGDIHDDLGSGLTKIALTSELVSMELKEKPAVSQKVGHMAEIARELSQSLKEVVWSVKPEYDNLESMMRYFKTYALEFFEDSDIQLTFNAPPFENKPVSPEDRRNLFLILKEALNNIVKHSGAKNVWIKISTEDHRMMIEISDNGIGIAETRPKEKINTSGINNIKARASALDMTVEIKKREPNGTLLLLKERSGKILLSGDLTEKNPG